jgi:hypothetical protein
MDARGIGDLAFDAIGWLRLRGGLIRVSSLLAGAFGSAGYLFPTAPSTKTTTCTGKP